MITEVIFIISLLAIGLVFTGYPLILWWYGRHVTRLQPVSEQELSQQSMPLVSVLVAVRNGEALIRKKVENALALDYPAEKLDVVIVSDGSDDGTMAVLNAIQSERLTALDLGQHLGKHEALNAGMQHCCGDIIVFTDADAELEPHAVSQLVRHFQDDRIGGVGGQRVIAEQQGSLENAQSTYIDADSKVKQLESVIGSVTANDGKIYAIRKSLFKGVAAAVTDDLYVCLSVLSQHQRFVFEPQARANIKTPSRNSDHEISRRRRIVNRSLRGIWLNRKVLNPFYSSFQLAAGLLINKVMRRLLPFFLITLLLSNLALISSSVWLWIFLLPQLGVYGAALGYWLLNGKSFPVAIVQKILSLCFYFVIGNLGTLLGVVDFLRGEQPVRWEPKKSD
ncbi:glycosyltransferase [Bacterioplanoides sp.]|uniref:glycosyltransferase n=1 Tax=Bacterioplanoides sp. TaxID=2066072 RepID=UPI003AFF93F7